MSEPDTGASPEVPRRRGRTRLAFKIFIGMLVAAIGLTTFSAYVLTERQADQVRRYPGVFAGMAESERPPPTDALNFLLLGSDSLADEPTTGGDAVASGVIPGAGRSDTIMLVHIDPGFTRATVVSIPRDAWVPVPGHGMAKVNAGYSWGGPSLAVRTIEGLTGVRVDHFGVIDFAGFQALTDSVGGIDVGLAAPSTFGSLVLHAGTNHLNGTQALGYVRQRTGLPKGDLDRVQRHQNALRALLVKITTRGVLTSPSAALGFLNELTRWITVDDSLTNDDLRTLCAELVQNLRTGGITFLTVPVSGLGRERDQSVVYLDSTRGARLWHDLTNGDIAAYLREYPGAALGESTR
ncbi:LCP family protein [Amycolatopsis sp. NPDC051128]|uniref:LCP family protein n=1 Tax=Amycolatopsis sp. NPDC051128 TaxID=3155412 RepID=UPI003422C2A5